MATVRRPTILIGIGGTGCLIAERVLGEAIAAGLTDASRVCIVGMDTDVKDLRKLRSIEKRFRIQTSDQRSLRELLLPPNWAAIEGWHLPMEAFSEDALSKSLLSGAGQIRMLSRLATHLAFKDGDARQVLMEAISRVTKLRNRDEQAGEVQVVITSSLAGATGSGSFLQIASVMDQLCREASVTGVVRGVFLMGDVLVRTQTLPTDQVVNAQFNTYAALAELNACNAFATGIGAPIGFRFEVAPGMTLQSGVPPMQTVTLIDYENDVGGNLGTDREAYYGMAVRAVYQHVFTPIGERLDAVLINSLRAKQRAEVLGRTPIYSGIGVHAIKYPRDAMADYIALEYASRNLSGEWLALDELYDLAYRTYETRRRTDPSAERPETGAMFLSNFKLLTNDSAFIKQQHLSLHPGGVDLDGNLAKPVHLRYLDAVVDEVLRQYWAVQPLPTAVRELNLPTLAQIEESEDVPSTVAKVEQALDRAWRAVRTTAPSAPSDIFRTVFSMGLEPERIGSSKDYHLKKWLVGDKLHLIATRWFLYALRAHLREERVKLKPDLIENAILGLGAQFKDPKKSAKADDAGGPRSRAHPEVHERARDAMRRGFLGLGNKRKEFAARYFQYQQTSIRRIGEWAETKVREQIYEGLLRELEGMIALVELTFERVKELKRKLDIECAETLGSHSSERGRGLFDGVLYVLGEPADKKRIADEAMKDALQSVEDGAETNAAIGELMFKEFLDARRANPANPTEAIAKLDVAELSRLIRERIVGIDAQQVVRSRLKPHYDFSVWKAVERDWKARYGEMEARRRAGEAAASRIAETPQKHLESLVEEVRRHAQPFIDYSTVGVGDSIIFWSVNPQIVEEFGDRALLLDILKSSPGENPDESDVHSTDQILCTHVRANLDLADVRKLHPGDGSDHARGIGVGIYRKAYLDEVTPLRRSNSPYGRGTGHITPHIDRNWHKAGLLPEIFPDAQKQVSDQIDRAAVIALTLGLIEKATPAGEGPVTRIDLSKLPGGQGRVQRIADSHDDWAIIGALRRNSDYALAAETLWDDRLKTVDATNAPLFNVASLEASMTPVLAMAAPQTADRDLRRATVESLLTRILELSSTVAACLMPQQTARARAAFVLQNGVPALRSALHTVASQLRLDADEARPMEELIDRVILAYKARD
jgi:hypothetical protein